MRIFFQRNVWPCPPFPQYFIRGQPVTRNSCQTLDIAIVPAKFDVIEYGDHTTGIEVYFRPVDDGMPIPISAGQDIFDDLPIALLKLKPTGQIIGANKAAKAKIGHKLAETQHLNTLFDAGTCSAVEWLAGGVAHDFNNLLTAISGHCDLLLLRFSEDDAEYGDLMQIQLNANRAAALIGQLLSFSRKQHLEFTLLHVRDLLSDLVHLLNRLLGEKIELVLGHGKDMGCINADARHLEQVITNLVVNARDAMPDGGKVMIETKNCNFISAKERQGEVIPVGNIYQSKSLIRDAGLPPLILIKFSSPFLPPNL